MQAGKNCFDLIKRFEGFRSKAYKDIAGILTIGYGHVIKSCENTLKNAKLTEEAATTILIADLNIWEHYVNQICSKYQITLKQYQFDALCSFCFNDGCFTKPMLQRLANKDLKAIGAHILEYIHDAKGNVEQGLIKRRQAEHDLFFS